MISKLGYRVGRRSLQKWPRGIPIFLNRPSAGSLSACSPFSNICDQIRDSSGNSTNCSPSNSNVSKATLKIKKQEGSAGVMPPFGDDESDEEEKKGKCNLSKKGGYNKKIKKDGKGKRDDDDDDEFQHKLSDDESHILRGEQNKAAQEKAMFVTKAGAVANVGLALSKGAVGFAISSTGLIADAANSLGDVLCDGVVYYTVQEARKTATPDSPWGRGKVESIG